MSGYEELRGHDFDLLERMYEAVQDFRAQTNMQPNVIRLSLDLHMRWVKSGCPSDVFEGDAFECPVEVDVMLAPNSIQVLRETFVPWDIPATATPLADLNKTRSKFGLAPARSQTDPKPKED